VPQAAPQPGAYPAPLEFSFSQPPLHLALLSLCTIGVYEIYWFYRTWKQLKQQAGDQISPGWRTVGLFVPILNIYLVYKLFDRISDLRLQSGVGPMFAPGWLTAFYLIWCLTYRLPDPAWLVSLASFVPLLVAQNALNELWGSLQPGRPVRTWLSVWEIALIVVGALLVLLTIVGAFVPE